MKESERNDDRKNKDDDVDDDSTTDSTDSDNNTVDGSNYQNAATDNDNDDDLTDRFKYKVHALMGTYDPVDGVQDDEYQDGNIMNALMQFPQRYKFNVVGRIKRNAIQSGDGDKNEKENHKEDDDDEIRVGGDHDDYVSAVKQVVFDVTGDDELVCEIKPRGTAFLKVTCEANVQSVTMINTIYDDLDKLDATVMRFWTHTTRLRFFSVSHFLDR